MTTHDAMSDLPPTRLDLAVDEIRACFERSMAWTTEVVEAAIGIAEQHDRLKLALAELAGHADAATCDLLDAKAEQAKALLDQCVSNWELVKTATIDSIVNHYETRARLADALRLERVLRQRITKLECDMLQRNGE